MASRSIADSAPTPTPPRDARPKLGSLFRRSFTILLIAGAIFLLLKLDHLVGGHAELPTSGQNLSYALLFMAGLFTGFHCVGMCGALVVGYTVGAANRGGNKYLTHVFYGAGKTLSYTAIGALFGAVGAIVTFTPFIRGVAGVAAGIFLLLFGLATLNVFPSLSRFRIKTPGFVMRFIGRSYRKNNHPFMIGLLNGLMVICGPLQAMYIMAAGTGSPVEGARLLFVFGLGTLPVMLGFGVLTSALSAQVAPKIVKASGAIVFALGLIMLNRGLAMIGTGYDFNSLMARFSAESPALPDGAGPSDPQVIHMDVKREGFSPDHFVVRKDVPVKWIIDGTELDSCNHRMVVPGLGLDIPLKQGENVVEFVPREPGVMSWSCSMGKISGTFRVEGQTAAPATAEPAAPPVPAVQVIHMDVKREGFVPDQFSLRKGVPVRWMITATALDYCNHRIVVPSLGLEFDIQPGENVIEFTPDQIGVVPWSCWMGMRKGMFMVHEDVAQPVPARPVDAAGHQHGHGDTAAPEWIRETWTRLQGWVENLRQKLSLDRHRPEG